MEPRRSHGAASLACARLLPGVSASVVAQFQFGGREIGVTEFRAQSFTHTGPAQVPP